MWPVLYQPAGGGHSVNTYGLFILLAFAAAFAVSFLRCRRVGIHPDQLIVPYFGAAVGGLVGARLAYAFIVSPAETFANPLSIVTATGGFVFYGGVVGGAIGVFAAARYLGLNGWKMADLVAPSLVIGLGVGRMGCFFSGCCHGAPAPEVAGAIGLLPSALLDGQVWLSGAFPFLTTEFHGGGGRIHNAPLYPTQLWSAAAGVGIAGFLMIVWSQLRRFDGMVAGLMLITEPVFRIIIESFRADHRSYFISWESSGGLLTSLPGLSKAGPSLQGVSEATLVGITVSQAFGLAMIVIGIVVLATGPRRGLAPETPVVEEEDD